MKNIMPRMNSLHIRSKEISYPSSHRISRRHNKYIAHCHHEDFVIQSDITPTQEYVVTARTRQVDEPSSESSDVSQISLISEVTIDSSYGQNKTLFLPRKHSAPPSWRKKTPGSKMYSAPDPDVNVMFLCTSSRQQNSQKSQESSSARSIREEYSSYRRRSSVYEACCKRQYRASSGSSSSSFSSYAREPFCGSDSEKIPSTRISMSKSKANGEKLSYLKVLESYAGKNVDSNWGYFVDSDTGGNEETSKVKILKQPHRRRRIF